MEENKLSEFAKLIQEGKKAKQEAEENKKKNFLQMYNIEEENISPFSFLSELSKLKKQSEEVNNQPVVEEPVEPPPRPQTPGELLSELASLISESKKANNEAFETAKEELEPFVEGIIKDIVELKQEEVIEEPTIEPVIQDPLIDKAVKSITKVAENTNLFSTPAPEKVPSNIKAIQDKLKYLEQWVGKISAAGPGSGSYWLNDLGDTDHASIISATDGQVLTYNDVMKKWIAADGGSGGTTDTYARALAQNSYDQANSATILAQSAYDYANTITIPAIIDQYARDTANSALPKSGGTITGSLTVTNNLNITGNATFSQNVTFNGTVSIPGTINQVSGNSGVYFGQSSNGFSALFAGYPGYTPIPSTIFQTTGYYNGYIQNNFQNLNNGNQASAEWVVTSDNGTDTTGYIDYGIASSSWDGSQDNSLGTAVLPNDGWVYVQNGTGTTGGHLILGATTKGKHVKIVTDGPNSQNVVAEFSNTGLTIKGTDVISYINSAFTKANNAYNQANVANTRLISSLSNGGYTVSLMGDGQLVIPQISLGGYTAGFVTSLGDIGLNANGNLWKFGADGTMNSPYSVKITTAGLQWPNGSTQNTAFTGYATDNVARIIAQSAYGQANTSTTISQAAFARANSEIIGTSAYVQANTAYDQANTATTIGQAAFARANSEIIGTAAYVQANTATTIGQAAYVQANTATTIGQAAYGQANTATTIGQAAFTKANTAITVSGGSISGQLNVAYTPVTSTGAALQISSANTQGGIGYADFIKVTNTSAGATNSNKYFRLTNGGTIEILNNAYSSPILSIADNGDFNVKNSININGKIAVNGPAFSVYQNTNQSIPTDVQTKVTWNVEEFDTNNNFASDRFTPTIEGYYNLHAAVRIDNNIGTGERMIVIYKNGSEYKRGYNTKGSAAVGDSWFQMSISCLVYANGTTDYFEVYVMHGAGVNRTLTGGTQFTYFQGSMARGG